MNTYLILYLVGCFVSFALIAVYNYLYSDKYDTPLLIFYVITSWGGVLGEIIFFSVHSDIKIKQLEPEKIVAYLVKVFNKKTHNKNIKVNKIKPFTCEFFDPNNKSLGFLNEYEMNDLRIQIKNNLEDNTSNISGYYALYNNKRVDIYRDGGIRDWADGFYTLSCNQLNELFGI